MFSPGRIDEPELLDEQDAPREDVERSLRDLRRFNRYFGGTSVYGKLLRRMAPSREERLSIIDLGTGTSDLLDSLDRPNLFPVGVDFKIAHLLYQRNGSRARRVNADALRLPFRPASVDIVTSAHFFHHFSPDANAAILTDALRIARRGVIINDTRRHNIPLLVTLLLGMFHLVGRITREDAPASIRRGYTIEEARAIAERAGARRAEVVRVWPFRFGLLLWT
jgi:ubiquinone/menaquinone biosynthesis C-methylase UbiE